MMSSSRGSGAVSDKAADDGDDGEGLGLKLRRIDSFPCYGVMTMNRNQSFSPLPQSPGDGDGDGDGDDDDGDDDYGSAGRVLTRGSSSNTGEDDACRSPVGGDISCTDTTALKYPGGGNMGADSGSFPFTGEQWKELERQAMIYKYIIASLPVPPCLLFPGLPANHLSRYPDSPLSYRAMEVGGSPVLNLRLNGRTDPEPGRCKRTDGKKWRCSKDVEPNQKYCDRHINRGRPRSRKPVERQFNNHPPSPFHHCRPSAAAPATAISPISPILGSPPHRLRAPSPKLSPFDFPSVSANAYQEQRRVDWERKEGSRSDRRMQGPSSAFNSYGDFSAVGDQQNREDCPMFPNPELLTLDRPPPERGFIDAWSNADKNESSTVSPAMKHSLSHLSDLTLSMAMDCGNLIEEMGPIQMGLGVSHSDQNSKPNSQPQTQPQVLGWLSSESWVSPTPGGPLAEVLKRPRSVTGGGRATVSRYEGDCGTTQRAVGSVSDSSDNSSPTLGTPTAWLNRGR